MNLLLRRNYGNVDCTAGCGEMVAVKTLDDSDWEHLTFEGFIDYDFFKAQSFQARKIRCNAWRKTFNEPWYYLGKDDYVVGVVANDLLYAVVTDGGGPYVRTSKTLLDTKARPKAAVINLFSKL